MPIEVAQMERQFAFGGRIIPDPNPELTPDARPRVLDVPVSGNVNGHHRWTGDYRPLSSLHHSAINREQRLSLCPAGSRPEMTIFAAVSRSVMRYA